MTDKRPERTEELYRGYTIIAGAHKGRPTAFVYRGKAVARPTPFTGEEVDGAVALARTWVDEQQQAAGAEREQANIGTVAQYVEAFTERPLTEKELSMLRAHARARVITTTQLAEAAGYPKYVTANAQYGRFGHAIADSLGLEPKKRKKDGTPIWISVLASGAEDVADDTAHFQWEMHPQVIEALAQAGLMQVTR